MHANNLNQPFIHFFKHITLSDFGNPLKWHPNFFFFEKCKKSDIQWLIIIIIITATSFLGGGVSCHRK